MSIELFAIGSSGLALIALILMVATRRGFPDHKDGEPDQDKD